MKLLDPASLAWLALLPVLVAFYLMKLRRKEAPVSALFLWQAAAREARVDSFFQRLKANLLLLLQILALLALGLGLTRPYMVVPGKVSDQVAIVLDVSASMGARQEGITRFEAARNRALTLVNQAPRRTEITLAAMGRETRVVVPFTTDKDQVRRALRSLKVQDVEEGAEGARSLLISILTSRASAEGYLLSDHLPTWEVPPRVSYLAHGVPGRNVAVSAFQIAPGDPFQAFAAVTSYSDRPETFPVTLRRGGREIYSRDVTVPAGSRRTLVLPVPPDGPPDFELRLELEDDLSADNSAWAVSPRQTSVRALVMGDAMRFAVKALVSLPGVEAYSRAVPGQTFDLTVWTEAPPEKLEPGVHLILEPPEGGAVEGPFPLTRGDDPMVRDLPLDRVFVKSVHPLPAKPTTRVLARAGPHPAITVERERGRTLVRLGFNLYESDFPLSPSFPIFISRVVDQLVRGLVGSVPLELVPGTALVLRTDQTVRILPPGGGSATLEPLRGEVVLADTTRAGLYRVELGDSVYFVAATLRSPLESDLRVDPGRDRLSAVAETGKSSTQAPSHSLVEEYWWELVLAALLVLLGEWYLYHRGTPTFHRRRRR
ncbi:MAG: BatA and WFA domain-containing protein [Candidatus Eremiobacterota bacterium]